MNCSHKKMMLHEIDCFWQASARKMNSKEGEICRPPGIKTIPKPSDVYIMVIYQVIILLKIEKDKCLNDSKFMIQN